MNSQNQSKLQVDNFMPRPSGKISQIDLFKNMADINQRNLDNLSGREER